MAKKRKKQKKERRRGMPELGWKDRLLYWSLMVSLALLSFVAMLYPVDQKGKLARGKPDVLAWAGDGSLQNLWLVVFLVVSFAIAVGFYHSKYPIFGRSDIRYGYPQYLSVYPLLMKNKPNTPKDPRVRARQKRTLLILWGIFAGIFLFCAAMYPKALSGRYELYRDGTVGVYDRHNQQVQHYGLGDMERVCLDVASHSKGRGGLRRYSVVMRFSFSDGTDCSFSPGSFGETWEESMELAAALKTRYGGLVQVEGRENLHKVARSLDLDPQETLLLYQLFGEE